MEASENNKNTSGSLPIANFSSPATTRALGLIAAAVLVAFLLVLIVDSDNNSRKSNVERSASLATTKQSKEKSSTQDTKKEVTTTAPPTTTKPISGTKDPSEVSILVLNGSNMSGIAGTMSTGIAGLKYNTLTAGNSETKAVGTTIYYKSGFQKDAEQLATNIIPGLLSKQNISQKVITKVFPASAPVSWDQENLVAANIVIVVGNVQ